MKANSERMLLGLAVSALSLAPGDYRTVLELAAFCGCSRQAIDQIEKRALRKVRRALGEPTKWLPNR